MIKSNRNKLNKSLVVIYQKYILNNLFKEKNRILLYKLKSSTGICSGSGNALQDKVSEQKMSRVFVSRPRDWVLIPGRLIRQWHMKTAGTHGTVTG